MKYIATAMMATILSCGPALAQTALDEAEDTAIPANWELSGNVGLFTDYRFRGISFSDKDLALQGGLDLAHSSGFYVGTWGSNLAGFGTFGGSNLEIDIYGGFGGDLGLVSYDVGLLWYMYPGTEDTDYAEIYASVGAGLGPADATVGVAYAPDQQSIGSEDNWYFYGDLGFGIPNTPFSVTAHAGYTDGSLGFGGSGISGTDYDDNYWDYSIGVSATVYGMDVGISYIDTDISSGREADLGISDSGSPLVADETFVVSVGYSF